MCDESKTRKQLEDELTVMRQRIAELESILETSRELTSALTLEPLLSKIITTAVELTKSEAASILLFDIQTGTLRFRATIPSSGPSLLDISVSTEAGIAGTIFTSQQPLIVNDAQADPRHYKGIDQLVGSVTRSLLGVPLKAGDRCVGVMEMMNKQGDRGFSQRDVDILTALAAPAAIAIENARWHEAVVDHAEWLEDRVRERTAELQAHNEELGVYDHTVAHDLKNPLTLVIGYATVLEEGYATMSDEELKKYLHTIVQHGHKMRSIIDELLLLSGVRDMEVEVGPLDMASIVIEAQRRLTVMIEKHRAEITLPDAWPVSLGYGPWVEEVWVNYLSNAIKYGGRPPRAELGAAEQADGFVRFWVHDNGPGIPLAEQPRLFSRFSQLGQDRTKGHGLGLSIVRRIVEKLGGHVGVESEIDQGSTFFFSLPGVDYQDQP